MSTEPDWADDVAAQIMVVAFSKTYAREVIAEIVRLVDAKGEQRGLDRAAQHFNELFPEFQPGRTP